MNRLHAYDFGMFDDQFEFCVFFDDGNDLAADFTGQHDHLDVLVVLEAIADDRSIVVGDGENGQQLRF